MRALVDTHVFLWEIRGDERSSRRAREILGDDSSELYFSMVSLWEIAINMKLGRLNDIGSSIRSVRQLVDQYRMIMLPVRYEHLLALEALPLGEHRDPFDRMLVAQAIAESLPILTRDESFKGYPVTVLW